MTTARAWIVSILVTVGVLALVVGLGASIGQFGFGNNSTEATAGTGDGPFVERSSAWDDEDDDDEEGERDDEGKEHEDDEDD